MRQTTVTWEKLKEAEPKLADLLAEARAARKRGGKSFCRLRAWYGRAGKPGLKVKLLPLVGWGREPFHPLLSTSEAYDAVYFKLLDAVGGCQHEGNCP